MINHWLINNNLPPYAECVFSFKDHRKYIDGKTGHRILIIANEMDCYNYTDDECDEVKAVETLFLKRKDSLINPLREVSSLLDTGEQWGCFAYALILSAAAWSTEDITIKRRKNIVEADKIKQEIEKKTIEIVKLANDLDKLDLYRTRCLTSREDYQDLLRKAADIHNAGSESQGLESQSLPRITNFTGCSYRGEFENGFLKLLSDAGSWLTLPSIESIILAYGRRFIEEETRDANPISFSQARSAGDFFRGFTSFLLKLVESGALPENIKKLSPLSIEKFAVLLFKDNKTPIDKYITADWNPKKDTTLKKKRRKTDHNKDNP